MAGLGRVVDDYLDNSSPLEVLDLILEIEGAESDPSENAQEGSLGDLLDRFLSADPRYHRTEQISTILPLLIKKSNDDLSKNIPKVLELMEWWNHALKHMEQTDPNLLSALDLLIQEVREKSSENQKRELVQTFARILPTFENDKQKFYRVK